MKPWTWMLLLAGLAATVWAEEKSSSYHEGTVHYRPAEKEEIVPEQFRLPEHTFRYQQESKPSVREGLTLSTLTFPSPVVTPHEENNTVHCEYFLPKTKPGEKIPAVVVLHILGGDFPLSRAFCYQLAEHRVAALFLKMPYYGPRRPEGVRVKMITENPDDIVRGMIQAVKDIRCASAWLAAQEEVDPDQLGIMGVSLGGIVSALAAEAEPRFAKVGLILAGGDVSQVAWQSKELRKVRRLWEARGGTHATLVEKLAPIDPVTYGKNLHGRKVLMLNASLDKVVPPDCTKSLWVAIGKPEIHWWNAGHYTAARYLPAGMIRICKHFAPESAEEE